MQELSDHIRSIVLPPSWVSLPAAEDGFVSLRQQTGLHGEEEVQNLPNENWRNKAIRRKLSKLKELVLFVGGLPTDYDKNEYVNRISLYTNKRDDACVGPVFPSQGCLFISFASGIAAACALKNLHDRKIFGKTPHLIFLPYLQTPAGSLAHDPLLVFINSKSGGGQGKQVYDMMKEILNKNQVFLLEQGGPIPGLYAFRKLPRFRILVCGGDGTAGWVLSCLELLHKHMVCPSPPIAILPLGTGNDLARVLGFGSGWSGENITTLLSQVQEAQPVKMDRWSILFDSPPQAAPIRPEPKQHATEPPKKPTPSVSYKSPDTNLINGHKPLQRLSKRNDARSGINIVMSIPNNHASEKKPTMKTASEFNETDNVNTSNNLSKEQIGNGGLIPSISAKVGSTKEQLNATMSTNTDTAHNKTRNDEIANKTCTNGMSDDSNSNDTVTSEDSKSTFFESGNTSESSDLIENSKPLSENSKADCESSAHRKTVHRKIQILSENDIMQEDHSFIPFQRQISSDPSYIESGGDHISIEKLPSDPQELETDEQTAENAVAQILKSELPDIINDKQKLITLLASVNMDENKFEEMINMGEEEPGTQSPDPNLEAATNDEPRRRSEAESLNKTVVQNIESIATDMKPRAMSEVDISAKSGAFKKKLSLPLMTEEQTYGLPRNGLANIQEEDSLPAKLSPGPKVVTMNNYFGIGIDADLTLAFHLAREENPEKFSSRLHNKAVYLKAGMKKMASRSLQLNNVIDLEVDGTKVPLPTIKGLIFLNISSWGAGSNAWGNGVSRRFTPQNMSDGLIEVVGVSGVPHMSQIYSGIRTGFRIAQGEFIRMHLNAEVAVQVDGEPWMQPPGHIKITVSQLQVTMLKRQKKKVK